MGEARLSPGLSLEAKGVFLGVVMLLRKGLTCFLASFISEVLRVDLWVVSSLPCEQFRHF